MINRRRFIAISAASFGTCAYGAMFSGKRETIWRGWAFGADAHIILRGDNAALAMESALDTIRRLESYFSIYDPESVLSKLNRNGHISMPPEFARLMAEVHEAHYQTDGLFDPTVQPLFLARLRAKTANREWQKTIGWQHVMRGKTHMHFSKSGMAITLNGIAQGFATDRVSEILAAYGFSNTQINIGEYRVGNDPVSLEVQDEKGQVFANRTIANSAMATSSRSGFTFKDGSGHILLPSKAIQQPVWNTATIVAETATLADAYSTALILTPNEKLAQKLVADGVIRSVILQRLDGKVIVV